MTSPIPYHRRPAYRGILLVLVLLLPLTWGLRHVQVSRVADAIELRQAALVDEALDAVEADFVRMEAELVQVARRWAADERIRRALRARRDEGAATDGLLVDVFAALRVPERISVELYDPSPQLLAWHGFSMPADEAINTPRFLETPQTTVVRDADWRAALVVWWPIREGGQVLGGIRALRLVYQRVSEQNQYLRHYSLGDLWSRATGLNVQVDLAPDVTGEVPPTQGVRVLQGRDGTVLARVRIQPPDAERILETTRTRYEQVMAFWAMLLLGWVMLGIWTGYRQTYHTARRAVQALEAGTAPGRASNEASNEASNGACNEASSGASNGASSGASNEAPTDPSVEPLLRRALGHFLLAGLAWWGVRYAFVALDVPNRWQRGKLPLAPLYDPTHLASTFGGGLMRSTGDLLLTAVFAVLFAVALLNLAGLFRNYAVHRRARPAAAPISGSRGAPLRMLGPGVLVIAVILGLVYGLALVTRHAILDSTLDYFARTGLLPERLVLVVFGALLLLTAALLMLAVGGVWIVAGLVGGRGDGERRRSRRAFRVVVGVSLGLVVLILLRIGLDAGLGLEGLVPWPALLLCLAAALGLAGWSLVKQGHVLGLLTLRNVLLAVFLLTGLLYGLLYAGIDARRRAQMLDAAAAVEGGRDPWAEYAVTELLEDAATEPMLQEALAHPPGPERTARMQRAAAELLRGSLISSLGTYDVTLTVHDTAGVPLVHHYEGEQVVYYAALDPLSMQEFAWLTQMYDEVGAPGLLVTPKTGLREVDRLQYVGIAPVQPAGVRAPLGWVQVRAEPRPFLRSGGIPFPRVLLPTGYGPLQGHLSVAHFRNGVLTRSFGRSFGRYRLDPAVQEALRTRPELWLTETVKGQAYLTYYQRQTDPAEHRPTGGPSLQMRVLAVRMPAITLFDHLYYLLRLTVAGLLLALPLYLGGFYARWRAGLIPASRVQFRDKVLNAFLAVGIITVGVVGFVGLQVSTANSEQAIQSWLEQHLERVEETLALEARGDEMPYRVLERIPIDSLAARVGLDLNVYRHWDLIRTSRPRLVRERLIDERLPIQVYDALYYEGYRFTVAREQVGRFPYTAGFRALPDEQGAPRYVIAVPTLPEQERIEEEHARTVAYLFGALL
ncbi:MAG: histidine kinase, partial [Bacteroidetes bacterium]